MFNCRHSQIYPVLFDWLGLHGTFWLYSGVGVVMTTTGAIITAGNGVIKSEAASTSVASLMFLALASAEVVVIATTRIRSEKPTFTEVGC